MTDNNLSRRSFLKIGAATLGGLLIPGVAQAAQFKTGLVSDGARRLAFRNTHTGESFSGVYRVGDQYLPDAFKQINIVMRDFRTDEMHAMDPRTMDILHAVQRMTGRSTPFEIISGYRSPKTNNMLRKTSSGVAKKSLHMQGRAVDLRMEDFDTSRLRDLAINLGAGGVGYYSRSNFVHLDSGDVRNW